MSKFCAIPLENNWTPEESKRIQEIVIKEAKKKGKTYTEFKGGFFKGVINFVRHFVTEDAAVFDAMKDAYDVNKQMQIFAISANRLKYVYAPIADNKAALVVYNEYKRARQIDTILKQSNEQEAVNKIPELRKHVMAGGTLEEFKTKWKEIKELRENDIANNENLQITHSRNIEFAAEKIDAMTKEFPDAMVKLLGTYDNPLEALDKIEFKLRDAKTSESLKEFYKKALGVDVDLALDNPEYLDLVGHHILDKYKANLRLLKLIIKDNVNNKLVDEIWNLQASATITPAMIRELPFDNPLRMAFDDAWNVITKDDASMEIFDKALDMFNDDTFQAIDYALKQISARDILKDNFFLNNVSVRNFIKSHKETMPNLNKVINGSSEFDTEALTKEMEIYNKLRGEKFELNDERKLSHTVNKKIGDILKTELNKRKLGDAKEILNQLAEKFPNHTLVTSNGTEVMKTDVKIEDIKDNKDIMGTIADLSNAESIFDDVLIIKAIQEGGKEALVNAIASNKINLVPTSKVELMQRIKKESLSQVRHFGLNKVNKIFSISTLFAPYNLPGYILGTQVWGNIGHTIAADPTAFKHWPKLIKEISKASRGRFEDIKDADLREIMRYMSFSEGNSMLGMTAEDFAVFENPEFVKEIESLQTETKNPKTLFQKLERVIDKWALKASAKVALVEMVSRGSMAYEILMKKRKGIDYLPTTANPHRVEHLWGFDDHLAAVRAANDTHIDYNNLPPIVRRIGRWMPFLSFKAGSAANLIRQIYFTTGSIKDLFTGQGNIKKVTAYTTRGLIGVAWRMGIAATIWNLIMVATGLVKKKDVESQNKFLKHNIFNELAGAMGMNFDNHFFIPGTGFKPVDKILRLGKGNQKGDVFSDVESMIPGLDKEWRDGTPMTTVISSKGVSMLSPIIKTPVEMMMGGGTIFDSGYRSKPKYEGTFETIINKMSPFIGLGTVTRTAFDMYHGSPNEYRSDGARDVHDVLKEIFEQSKQDGGDYDARKAIGERMRYMDVDGTAEAVRQYEHLLQGQGLTTLEIHQKIRSAISYYTISEQLKRNRKIADSLNEAQADKYRKAIAAQQDFLTAIGFGRW